MGKVALAVFGGKSIESLGCCRDQFVKTAASTSAHEGFEFRKGHFDGIEVGTVGWQVDKAGSIGLDGLLGSVNFVRWKVIADYDVVFLKGGSEALFQPGHEEITVDGSVQKHGCTDAVVA